MTILVKESFLFSLQFIIHIYLGLVSLRNLSVFYTLFFNPIYSQLILDV